LSSIEENKVSYCVAESMYLVDKHEVRSNSILEKQGIEILSEDSQINDLISEEIRLK
jgi:hypothetical protein